MEKCGRGGGTYGQVLLNEITTLLGDAEWNVRLEMLSKVGPETLNALGFDQARYVPPKTQARTTATPYALPPHALPHKHTHTHYHPHLSTLIS